MLVKNITKEFLDLLKKLYFLKSKLENDTTSIILLRDKNRITFKSNPISIPEEEKETLINIARRPVFDLIDDQKVNDATIELFEKVSKLDKNNDPNFRVEFTIFCFLLFNDLYDVSDFLKIDLALGLPAKVIFNKKTGNIYYKNTKKFLYKDIPFILSLDLKKKLRRR